MIILYQFKVICIITTKLTWSEQCTKKYPTNLTNADFTFDFIRLVTSLSIHTLKSFVKASEHYEIT
jgi:hypothetical protein